MKKSMVICVIGAGPHACLHGEALRRITAEHPAMIRLAAVCDLDKVRAGKYAADFGFEKTYDDYRLMLEQERPAGVLVMTPPKTLRQVAGDVLAAGCPTLMEKPPGWTVCDTAALLEIAERGNVPHMISFNRRFGPAMIRARQWLVGVRDQRPPELVHGKLVRINRVAPENVFSTGIHVVDTIISCLEPASVVDTVSGRAQGRQDNIGARLVFDNGAEGLCTLAFNAGDYEEVYEVFGRGYHLTVDVENGWLAIRDQGRLEQDWRVCENMPVFEKYGIFYETWSFINVLRTGVAMWPDLHAGLDAVRVAAAVAGGHLVSRPPAAMALSAGAAGGGGV